VTGLAAERRGGIWTAAKAANTLGESPVWCERAQALYWVDIRAPALLRLDTAGTITRWPMPDLCAGVVLAEDGLVLAMRHGLAWFDPAGGRFGSLLPVESAALENRLNEIGCDRRGRLWVGSMRDYGAATTGALYRIDADLSARRVLADITIPNSLCWSPDGATMYFADSGEGGIRAYPFDGARGLPDETAARILIRPGAAPGRPDGSAIDAAGFVWNARVGGGCLVRIAPDGRIDRVIPLPVSQPTACTFGGRDLHTLYITTARQRLPAAELPRQQAAGDVLAMRVNVPGLPAVRFAGTAPHIKDQLA